MNVAIERYLNEMGLVRKDFPDNVIEAAEAEGEWGVFTLEEWWIEHDMEENPEWYAAEEAARNAAEEAWACDEFDRARKGEYG